jgi:hypothetical protein
MDNSDHLICFASQNYVYHITSQIIIIKSIIVWMHIQINKLIIRLSLNNIPTLTFSLPSSEDIKYAKSITEHSETFSS